MTYQKSAVQKRMGLLVKVSTLAVAGAFCFSLLTPTSAVAAGNGPFPSDPKGDSIGTGGAPDEYSTGSMTGDHLVTQLDFIKWFASLTGDTPLFDELSSVGDYVFWAHRMGMKPKGGWNPDATLSREMFAELLADVFKIKVRGNENVIDVLDREGISIVDEENLTWDGLVSVIDEDGFTDRLAVFSHTTCSPVSGDKYKVGNNKCTPPPPPVQDQRHRRFRGGF